MSWYFFVVVFCKAIIPLALVGCDYNRKHMIDSVVDFQASHIKRAV